MGGVLTINDTVTQGLDELSDDDTPSDLAEISNRGMQMDAAMILSLEASKRAYELLDERAVLVAEFEETKARLEAVRDGARAGNVDWSLCAG